MLVIHPEDRTTTILQVLYKGLGAQVVTEDCSNREIGHLLHHTSPIESCCSDMGQTRVSTIVKMTQRMSLTR